MRDRRPVEITIILIIGIALIALIIYFGPKNPYCFGDNPPGPGAWSTSLNA
jgi:hypothetical protein